LGKTGKSPWYSVGDFHGFGNDKPLRTRNFGDHERELAVPMYRQGLKQQVEALSVVMGKGMAALRRAIGA
jgi:hypothetical protein